MRRRRTGLAVGAVLLGGCASGGCASGERAKLAEAPRAPAADASPRPLHDERESGAEALPTTAAPRPRPGDAPPPEPTPAKPAPAEDRSALRRDPAYGKTVETRQADPGPPEPERSVRLPDELDVAAPQDAPALPGRSLVAVAFVRGGRLVRRPDALRRLAHELAKDDAVSAVVALEPLSKDAPELLELEQLAGAAARQGAHVLVVDARGDDGTDGTTIVLHAGSRRVLAHVKPRAAGPSDGLVARLVRVSRA